MPEPHQNFTNPCTLKCAESCGLFCLSVNHKSYMLSKDRVFWEARQTSKICLLLKMGFPATCPKMAGQKIAQFLSCCKQEPESRQPLKL